MRYLAAALGPGRMQLFNDCRNLARRLLETFRYIAFSEQAL
jgi:hypothetical protein